MFIVLTADSSKDVVPRVRIRIRTTQTHVCLYCVYVCVCVFLICPIKDGLWPWQQGKQLRNTITQTFTQIEPDLWLYRKELQDEAEEGKASEFKFLDRKIDRERMVQDKDVSVGFSRQESHSAILATHIYMVLWFLNYISQRMSFIERLKD